MVQTIPAASGGTPTVPTDAYRNGNFNQVILGNGAGGAPLPFQINGHTYTDPLGRQFPSGTIFDPNSSTQVLCSSTPINGLTPDCNPGTTYIVRNPYSPANQVPLSSFDPVPLRILNLVPKPIGSNFASGQTGLNYQTRF
jgi:hypothetical protein